MTSLDGLVARWREEAERLRERYGLEELARVSEVHAAELAGAIQAAEDEELDLTQAALESGYAPRTLRLKIANGVIPNAGEKHSPRIRRGDLPRRRKRDAGAFDPAEHARSIMQRGSV